MYGLSEWGIEQTGLDTLTNKRDYAGPLVCGFTSGLVFKSTGKFLIIDIFIFIAGPRGAFVAGLIGMGVVAAIRFTQNTLLPKLGVSKRRSHILFI